METTMETAISEPSVHEMNLRKVREAATALGCKQDDAVYCEFSMKHKHDQFSCLWRVTMFVPNTRGYLNSGEAPTIEEAIDKCVAAVKKERDICKVCGGRMDGPCKHSHE